MYTYIYTHYSRITISIYSGSHSQVSFAPDSTVHRFDNPDSIHLVRYVSFYPTNPNT
ncbi:unnamed protein product [Penicillium nalgiovense]|nr:unnamed protein product [Penicillium nalgiovense]